jgi:hypothetical protein
MQNVADIFSAFGGPSALARALKVNTSTASEMKRRRSIPPKYWFKLLSEAKRQGLNEITADLLAKVHAEPSRQRTSQKGEAA